MENLKKCSILLLIAAVVSSCFFDRRPKDVNPFYTTRNFGQFPVMPLVKPIKLLQDDQSLEWNIEIPHSFKNKMGIYNQKNIGIDKTFIYGKLSKKKINYTTYKNRDYLYFYKYGTTSLLKEPSKFKEGIRLYPIDSASKTFILPERWFVINVADSTVEAFFSETKYKDYLRDRGIPGKMYNIDKYHKQFKETGVLPWFPDSIKVKLKK